MSRTYHYTCSIRDGKDSDGTWYGTVKADSEPEAHAKIKENLYATGKRRRPKSEWRAYNIHLT
jgi:hypothetical protein